MIYTLYKKGYRFVKTNASIETYEIDGMSNHPVRSTWLNYRIVTSDGFNVKKFRKFIVSFVMAALTSGRVYRAFRIFVLETFTNTILSHVPIWTVRRSSLKTLRTKLAKERI